MKTVAESSSRGSTGIQGPARLDKRTKDLVKRLKPGDIAIINHMDIDKVSAESLIERKPAAVVNSACSMTGSYPNLGPLMIVASGIPIIDEAGERVFEVVREGDRLELEESSIYRRGELVSRGTLLTLQELELRIEASKATLGKHLGDFAANTVELLEAEKEILLETVELPHLATRFQGRHALIVVRGHDYKRDLQALRPYIREIRPVLVGVDGGADALVEMGYRPDMVIGDMDSVSDRALGCGAELVVHGYADGRAPGRKRLDDLALSYSLFHYPGTSEDIAMLIAYEKNAELISVVGGHSNLIDFLDKDRKGMASTFLVRLRVGPALVDAKGISKLYKSRVKWWHLALVLMAALAVAVLVILVSEPVRQFISVLAMRVQIWLMKLQDIV